MQVAGPGQAAEQTEEARAALGLLAQLLKAEPVLGLELAQMAVPGRAALDLPSMLASAIDTLCSLRSHLPA